MFPKSTGMQVTASFTRPPGATLTPAQRQDLQKLGAETVRLKLASYDGSRLAFLNGFLPSGSLPRGDVEDWLAEQSAHDAAQQRSVAWWVKIAGVSGIIAAIAAVVGVIIAAVK